MDGSHSKLFPLKKEKKGKRKAECIRIMEIKICARE